MCFMCSSCTQLCIYFMYVLWLFYSMGFTCVVSSLRLRVRRFAQAEAYSVRVISIWFMMALSSSIVLKNLPSSILEYIVGYDCSGCNSLNELISFMIILYGILFVDVLYDFLRILLLYVFYILLYGLFGYLYSEGNIHVIVLWCHMVLYFSFEIVLFVVIWSSCAFTP